MMTLMGGGGSFGVNGGPAVTKTNLSVVFAVFSCFQILCCLSTQSFLLFAV